jgi:hypothetical protein
LALVGRRCSPLNVIDQASAKGQERQETDTGKSHVASSAGGDCRCCPPNEMRISCGRSCPRPHNPTFHSALPEVPPERRLAPQRPGGCMRGLGSRFHEGSSSMRKRINDESSGSSE